MKHVTFFLLVSLMWACNSAEFPQLEISREDATPKSHTTIGTQEALAIAAEVTCNTVSTNVRSCFPEIQYVLKGAAGTRTVENALPDTLAYVINYSNNGGFAIVSSVACDNPVLGFSRSGSFSFDNEAAVSCFVDEIEGYLETALSESDSSVLSATTSDASLAVNPSLEVEPIVRITMGQGSPWNAQVVTEDSAYLAGCVAVATALVMSHSKESLTYHNTQFPFKTMLDLIEDYQNASTDASSSEEEVESASAFGRWTDDPVMLFLMKNYTDATNAMAYLIKYICEDVKMTLGTSASSASSKDAYATCVSAGYTVVPSSLTSYSLWDVISYLQNGYLIYMDGTDYNRWKSHAWVVDGCKFNIEIGDTTITSTPYLHCDWGWSGLSNGYFNGAVFSASTSRNYTPLHYFGVEIEK